MTLTFQNVILTALQRRYSPQVFCNLLREFSHQNSTPELIYLFQFSIYPKSYWALLRLYIYEVLIVSDFNNTSESFNLFWEVLPKLNSNDQIECLTYLNQLTSMNKINWGLYLPNGVFIDHITIFIHNIINGHQTNTLQLMISKILSSILASCKDNNNKLPDKLINCILEFHGTLKQQGLLDKYKIFDDRLNDYQSSSSTLLSYIDDSSLTTVATSTSTNTATSGVTQEPKLTQKENVKVLKLKKFIWLNQNITVEFNEFDEFKTNEFKTLLNLSNVSTTDAINFMTIELITGLFNGLEMTLVNKKFIWENYIIWTLPGVLKYIFKINQVKLESCLNTIKSTDEKLWNKNHDLLLQFEKSLVELDLLKFSNSIFGTLASTTNTSIPMTLDELTGEFNQKLIEANPEFISIDDSNIEVLLSKIKPHIILREKFNKLVNGAIQSFIISNDFLRLRRLIICLCIDQDILFSLLLSSTSPYKFIEPLLKLIERNIMEKTDNTGGISSASDNFLQQTHSSDIMGDMGFDLDSSNVQSDFTDSSIVSITSIFIQFIIKKFQLSLTSNEIIKLNVGNTLSMLTYCPQALDIKDKEQTVNKWITSLFDITNTEGISDSLIKASSPLEYSIILPEILNNCIQCYQFGWVNEEMVENGLDYFKEIFLSGWLPNIINELCNIKWNTNEDDQMVVPMLIKCILKLLNNSDIENKEMKIAIGLVREISNDSVWNLFNDQLEIKQVLHEPVKKPSTRDMFKLLIKWVDDKDDESSASVESVFDLMSIWESMENSSLPIEDLFNELISLISNPIIPSDLSYELISLLIITYSKWKTNGDLKYWVKEFVRIKEYKGSNCENSEVINDLISNRSGKDGVWTGLVDVKPKEKSEPPEDENDFFGFIQEPRDEDDPMDFELPVETKESGENFDLFALTMFQIFVDKTNSAITEKLIRKIVNYL